MLSINTNISSLIAQTSLKTSTQKLNTAIERMTTGYKINGAKDNAANYSISTNMTTKIGAYQVAEDNVAMGLDMVMSADETLGLVDDKLARLRALATQAANGTYGQQSLRSINKEASAIIDEIYRIKNSAEYNGQKIFGGSQISEDTVGASGIEVNEKGFLQDIEVRDVSGMTSLSSVDETQTLATGTYSICSAEELAKLAKMQNSGKVAAGSEFVLGADIDLIEYSDGAGWTPIGGAYSNMFQGTFDGNGHKISNLYVNRPTDHSQGLFGSVTDSTIKNIGVENGNVVGSDGAGGLIGKTRDAASSIINCYSNASVDAQVQKAGGLVGEGGSSIIDACYAIGSVSSLGTTAGGLVGSADANFLVTNSFATGDVYSNGAACGGLVGRNSGGNIVNCFATGNISGSGYGIGGLVGTSWEQTTIIKNCHATGNVLDKNSAYGRGGLIGVNNSNVENCYATGSVTSLNGRYIGGLIGWIQENHTISVKNSFSTGDVNGGYYVGGFIGFIERDSELDIDSCYSTGDVNSTYFYVSGFIGNSNSSLLTVKDSYAAGDVKGSAYVESFVRGNVTATNCYYSGVTGGTGNPVKDDYCIDKGCEPFSYHENTVGLQVGINGGESSRISIDTACSLGSLKDLKCFGIYSKDALSIIDNLSAKVSAKQTQYGAAQNRLESALEEISTQYENLVSSRSTLKDVDISKESSEYIKQQILQQASATLLSTANQTPALALQLL